MARMHSRKHGKSSSTRPRRKTTPKWVKYKKNEVEKLVVKFANQGESSAKIGIILRDSFGIPSVKLVTGKKICKIIEENGLKPKIPEDMFNLMKKVSKLKDHLKRHKKDASALHGLELMESKIRRLGKFYKKKGQLPEDWKYEPEKLKSMAQ